MNEIELLRESNRLQGETLKGLAVLTWFATAWTVAGTIYFLYRLTQ